MGRIKKERDEVDTKTTTKESNTNFFAEWATLLKKISPKYPTISPLNIKTPPQIRYDVKDRDKWEDLALRMYVEACSELNIDREICEEVVEGESSR